MQREIWALLSVATVAVLSPHAGAGPTGVVVPTVAPKPVGTVALAPHITIPPPTSSAWLRNLTISPGGAPKDAALIRIDGNCIADQECFLYGHNLGRHDGLGRAPAGFELVATSAKGSLVLPITAWTENLIAFTSPSVGGPYTVSLRSTSSSKVLSSVSMRVHVPPPPPPPNKARAPMDDDHDNVDAMTDCDDWDPLVHPTQVEVNESNDKDEDCDPTTYGKMDSDGDGHFDARFCNIFKTGSGADRYFAYNCGDDCDDRNNAVFPGQMTCDPRGADPTIIVLCVGHSGTGPADPRSTFNGTWAALSCKYYAGDTGHCVRQPNGTGICVP
jgi:hypothetical protein